MHCHVSPGAAIYRPNLVRRRPPSPVTLSGWRPRLFGRVAKEKHKDAPRMEDQSEHNHCATFSTSLLYWKKAAFCAQAALLPQAAFRFAQAVFCFAQAAFCSAQAVLLRTGCIRSAFCFRRFPTLCSPRIECESRNMVFFRSGTRKLKKTRFSFLKTADAQPLSPQGSLCSAMMMSRWNVLDSRSCAQHRPPRPIRSYARLSQTYG